MDTMQIHCPGCGVRLDVPANAGGRPARCPKCKTRFRVPEPHVMLDETVTCWLNLDQMHQREEREDLEELLEREFVKGVGGDGKKSEVKGESGISMEPTTIEAMASGSAAEKPVGAEGGKVTNEPAKVQGPHGGQTAQHGSSAAIYAEPANGGSSNVRSDRVVRRVVQRQQGASGTSNRVMAETKSEEGQAVEGGQPTRRFVPMDGDIDQVKLHVLGVGAYGVRLGFACRLLDTPAFRASMPMRGMVSGETDPTKLIARPLAWVDKATGHFTNPGELEARYELHVKLHQTVREVVEAMRPMDELPSPFNLPMPYYVGREDTSQGSLHCETVATPRGIQCEVVIPSIRYAMDWLGRVNGVCGADYQQLETEAMKFEAGSWRTIPQQVRHRLAVWFEFQGDEQFLGYLGDSDFARNDLGLAGVIVTTQRIVWCKYHYHGAVLLNEPGIMTAVERGRFADLSYRGQDGVKRKMVRLRCEDVDVLADMLSELDMAMTMQIETAAPTEDGVMEGDSGVISVANQNGKPQ